MHKLIPVLRDGHYCPCFVIHHKNSLNRALKEVKIIKNICNMQCIKVLTILWTECSWSFGKIIKSINNCI